MKGFRESALFEHKFWLQVLGDHARFIKASLYPSEKQDIEKANYFVHQFDELLMKARQFTGGDLIAFSKTVSDLAKQFKSYKLSILKRQLSGEIGILLSETFMNHTVNELEEYLIVLKYLTKGEEPPIFHELHHHLLWLQDAYGHAGIIDSNLAGVEKRLKEKSQKFTTLFEGFYLKAVELTGYLRSSLKTFPALDRFNSEVELEMTLFRNFLHEIEELELSEKVLGTLSGLMADHMAREECYYLIKLAESSNVQPPNCDPTKPRTEDLY
jgi:hypothetical protein